MINLDEVGAHQVHDGAGNWQVKLGIYLPGITFNKCYRLRVRIIHQADQFIRGIEPKDFWMSWVNGSPLDLWQATVPLAADAASHFGQDGKYLYRYQLQRADGREVTFWFADPFGRDAGIGTLSAFTKNAPAFAWTDAAFRPPEVDEMVVYELNVREFNRDFEGVVAQLDYLKELGINTIELMPITNVKEDVEWGYTPLNFYSPDTSNPTIIRASSINSVNWLCATYSATPTATAGATIRYSPSSSRSTPAKGFRCFGMGRSLEKTGACRARGSDATSSSVRCIGNTSTMPRARRSCGCTASWARCGAITGRCAAAVSFTTISIRRISRKR